VSEDAAQKRVSRAVERLREFFSRRGVTIGTSGLAVIISANAVQAAPVGLALTISTTALAGSTLVTTTTATATTKVIAMTTLQKALIAGTVVGLATITVLQHQSRVRLREQNASLRQELAQLQSDNENLARSRTPLESMAMKLPAPRVGPATRGANADELQITNLSARLKDYSAKLTSDQVAQYLSDHQRSAASLLAAYRTTGDAALLEEAKRNFPKDAQVAFEAAFAKDAAPEERKQWLDAFKQAAPENALPNYLSALNHFKSDQPDQAVQELLAAAGKQQFKDYTLDRMQDDEEAYLAAGHSVAEAKTIPGMQLLLPQLGQCKELSEHLIGLANSYRESGDPDSAQSALQLAAQLGRRYGNGLPGEATISLLVGIAVEGNALRAMDPTSPYGEGKTVKDRLAELTKLRADISVRARQMEPLQSFMTDQDWITYKDRWRVFGEDAAAKWLIGKYGQKASQAANP
jgi:FtsZ-binding cell division protein ZapB